MKAQIQNQDAICIDCREGITNPICPECLAREMNYWKSDIGTVTPMATANTGVKCLFCGRDFNICAHCYSRDIYDLIKEKHPELAEEFLDMFGLKEDFL
jgi:hypothetical protein